MVSQPVYNEVKVRQINVNLTLGILIERWAFLERGAELTHQIIAALDHPLYRKR